VLLPLRRIQVTLKLRNGHFPATRDA
jgi:hypothetical protein